MNQIPGFRALMIRIGQVLQVRKQFIAQFLGEVFGDFSIPPTAEILYAQGQQVDRNDHECPKPQVGANCICTAKEPGIPSDHRIGNRIPFDDIIDQKLKQDRRKQG